jgi:hypothetical protein
LLNKRTMKFNNIFRFIGLFTLAAAIMVGCKKEVEVVTPPSLAHFTNLSSGNYIIATPTTTYQVPVGVSTVSDKDRTVNVAVTSSTGAVQGTHYTLTSTSVVIPAGKAVGSIEVKGVYNQYLSGRKDTLTFTLSGTDLSVAEYNNEFKLLVRGACPENVVNLNDLLGEYKRSNEEFGGTTYGPYTTAITAVTQDPVTKTGTITVANIWNAGWKPITFKLDWSDPANRKVTVSPSPQTGIGDAGTLSTTYSGQDVAVANHSSGQIGTFSICSQTITIKMQLGVTGLGYFAPVYNLTMAR